jgi:hypothetical protein
MDLCLNGPFGEMMFVLLPQVRVYEGTDKVGEKVTNE